MSEKNFLRFRPALENLDNRAMPSSLNLTTADSGPVARDIEPHTDERGDWICYYTENSCECEPWPY